jgi:hypothetical protein
MEKVPEYARRHRILSKCGQSAVISIQLENGEYTTKEKGTLEELTTGPLPWFRNNLGTFWRLGRS